MAQQKNLPINEPGLQGIAQPVSVGDPTGVIDFPDEPKTMQRRLWVLYPLASLSISAISGAVNTFLLGKMISTFPGGEEVGAAASLGLTLSISGISYLIAVPLIGILSDKTRTRFLGRRNLWVLISAVTGAIALLALSQATNLVMLIVLATVATIPVGGVLAAVGTVVPERVPISSRGRISSLNGMMGLIGAGLGIVAASSAPSTFIGFVILAVQLVVFCAIFAFFTKDVPAPPRVDKSVAATIPRLRFPSPKSHPDFWLTFVARGLAFMAYGLATGLQLFALRDWFKVGDGTTAAAQAVLGQVTLFSLLALAIAALLGGILVDKFGRLKPFVVGSSLLFVPAALALTLIPSLPGALIGFTITGLAFGSYISVDGVLMTRVIPSKTNAGRDLGVLNVSGGVGSIVAPVLGGAIVATTGYGLVFLLVIVAGALASLAVLFIRSVR